MSTCRILRPGGVTGAECSRSPRLRNRRRAPAGDEVEDNEQQADDEGDVDESARDLECEPDDPQRNQHESDDGEHACTSSPENGRCGRSLPACTLAERERRYRPSMYVCSCSMRNCLSSSIRRMTSRMEMTPQTFPESSTRRWRVKWSRIRFEHSVSDVFVSMSGRSVRIASPTGIDPESPRARTRETRSRSVTSPMIFPPSRTATEPTLRSDISRAASRQGVMESRAMRSRVTWRSIVAMDPPAPERSRDDSVPVKSRLDP